LPLIVAMEVNFNAGSLGRKTSQWKWKEKSAKSFHCGQSEGTELEILPLPPHPAKDKTNMDVDK
jgi:hypothetical protein